MLWIILLVVIPFVIAELYMALRWGMTHREVVCERCGARGKVRMKQVMTKPRGESATISMNDLSPVTIGLRRKEVVTQAHCRRCGMTWYTKRGVEGE